VALAPSKEHSGSSGEDHQEEGLPLMTVNTDDVDRGQNPFSGCPAKAGY